MKKQFGLLTAVCFMVAGSSLTTPCTAAAQASDATTPPPKVLVIEREFLKPGKAGSVHEKSERAFVEAMTQANSPVHYLAMNSLSGKLRTLFLLGYDSFADWQKGNVSMRSDSTLAQAFDSAQQADGELLASKDTGVFVYQPEISVRAPVDIPHMRFMEITEVKVRPGHDADWNKLIKLYNSIFGNVPTAHWAAYRILYGDAGGIYLFIDPMKSMADIDQDQKASEQAFAAASADQKQQMSELTSSAVESIGTNLFAFSPKMSYVGTKWKNADPGFWKQ